METLLVHDCHLGAGKAYAKLANALTVRAKGEIQLQKPRTSGQTTTTPKSLVRMRSRSSWC